MTSDVRALNNVPTVTIDGEVFLDYGQLSQQQKYEIALWGLDKDYIDVVDAYRVTYDDWESGNTQEEGFIDRADAEDVADLKDVGVETFTTIASTDSFPNPDVAPGTLDPIIPLTVIWAAADGFAGVDFGDA